MRIDVAGAEGKTITLVATPGGKTEVLPQDGSVKAAVVRGEAGWTLEAALPLGQIGKADEIRLNIQRKTGATTYALAPLVDGRFDYDTAAAVSTKAPGSQPVDSAGR